jgi:hypothetical protein
MTADTPSKPGRTAYPLTPAQAMQVGDAEFLDFILQSAADARQSAAKSKAVIEETRAILDEPETAPKPPAKRGGVVDA